MKHKLISWLLLYTIGWLANIVLLVLLISWLLLDTIGRLANIVLLVAIAKLIIV